MDELKFEVGYPTAEASEALYDEMDYQRAQAYARTEASLAACARLR